MSAASPVNPNIKFNTDVKKNDNVKLNETPLSYKELKKAAEKVKGSKLTLKERIGLKIFGKKIKNISKKVEREGKDKKTQGKGRTIALVLALLIGNLGIHRFYLGYTWQGVVQLLTLGGCGIWTIIDWVRIITGDLKPKSGDYDPDWK
ncbi:MAG: TM2 domain-containing protein [Bacteroidetes bacterium]|nr:MAG: TM2 domain-containing protein [Bacteroidota bacterium]